MTTKTVFYFDYITGLFTCTYEAQESPEEPDTYITPVHSTPKPIPQLAANEAAMFDVQADAWMVVPDFRGQTFYDQTTGAEVVIDAHGAVPANLAATKPIAVLLDEAKTKQSISINTNCATAIVGGFDSNALGAAHHYTATLEDQANLIGLITIGSGGEYTCTNAALVKARRLHTLAELKTVLADGGVFKDSCLARARLLKDQIAAIQPSATAVADVEAIVWTLP